MSRIATVRPVGHIGQRKVRRRVGPPPATGFALITSGDQTEAGKAEPP
jgi:hypothetical protein